MLLNVPVPDLGPGEEKKTMERQYELV